MRDMLIRESVVTSQMLDTPIIFDDLYLNVKGHYVWKKSEKKVTDIEGKLTKDVTLKYVQFNILKNKEKNIEPLEIIDKIINYVDEMNKDYVELNYIKLLSNGKESYNHVVPFYEGKKEPFEQLETRYINSLFHQEKDRLWSLVKNCCLNQQSYKDKGQCGRVSLVLYGPPGTGKSTLAYRIAMCMYRQLISLDLRDLTKTELYQTLHNPNSKYCSSYKDAVFLFEEIDASIKELYLRGKKQESAASEYENRMMKYYGGYGGYGSYKKYGNYGSNYTSNYTITDKDADTQPTEITKETDKDTEKDTKNVTNKFTSQYDEISKLSKVRTEFNIRDLLEVFQGPVPFEQMIIIANTNKFDEIKDMCPELFRPGRLTPIYFGYVNRDTLQDISKYYFDRKITGRLPEIIKIPTSQIIELALEASQSDGDNQFEQFSSKLNVLIDEIKD